MSDDDDTIIDVNANENVTNSIDIETILKRLQEILAWNSLSCSV